MKNEFNFADNIDKTKITLIRHYMAEKGMDSADFDEQLAKEINELLRSCIENTSLELYESCLLRKALR